MRFLAFILRRLFALTWGHFWPSTTFRGARARSEVRRRPLTLPIGPLDRIEFGGHIRGGSSGGVGGELRDELRGQFSGGEELPFGDFSGPEEFERFAALPPIAPGAVDDIDWHQLLHDLTRAN